MEWLLSLAFPILFLFFSRTGCKWTGSLRQYLQQEHESKCEEELVTACSNGCGAMLAGKLHQQHHEKECPKEKVCCAVSGCGVKVERAEEEEEKAALQQQRGKETRQEMAPVSQQLKEEPARPALPSTVLYCIVLHWNGLEWFV